jgi:hypothetical protein
MTKKPAKPSSQNSQPADASLDSRYGAIGISALAAALQFKPEVKNPAYAPALPQSPEEQLSEVAA